MYENIAVKLGFGSQVKVYITLHIAKLAAYGFDNSALILVYNTSGSRREEHREQE